MNRKARDRLVAQQFVNELTTALGGPVMPETLAENSETVCRIFGDVLDRHQIVAESAAACVMRAVPRVLAKAELQRQLAMRRAKGTLK